LGVNLNFAPVVDLNYRIMNPDDRYTRIYQRAVSRDPEVVAQVAAWYCAALEEAGVRCTLKHFPGLGRVRDDTHLRHADLATPVAELTGSDWIPFLAVMRQSRAFTMLAHVRLTAIDPERPVSFSPKVVTGMIRSDWKHDGVLITDNFSMYAVYGSRAGIDNASIQALNAGVDLILISYDPDQYYRVMYALLKASRHGKLAPEALHRSDQRLAGACKWQPFTTR
jgi:beta-N-acetylhexosaminidase